MTTRAIGSFVSKLMKTAETYGVMLPKKTQDAISADLELLTQAENYQVPNLSLVEAVLDAFREGKEPHESADVITAVVAQNLSQNHNIAGAAREALASTIRKNIDPITEAFEPTYNKAGSDLAEAHKILTEDGINEIGQVDLNRVSVPIATQAVKAREAILTLRDIRDALSILRQAVGASTTQQNYIEYTASWVDIGGYRSVKDPWEALTEGHTISLATTEEADSRKELLFGIDAQRERDYEDSHKQQYRHPGLAALAKA